MSQSMSQPTCKDRLSKHYKGRVKDLGKLWALYLKDSDASDPELGNMYEYGLAFDYVPSGTFTDQRRGYFRYQLSWGGPSDEFRFYVDEGLSIDRIEYWFLDWFDGAHKTIRAGKAFELLSAIYGWFNEAGACESEMQKALA